MFKRNSPPPASGSFKPYLFAETHFERSGEAIFILAACEQLRRIPVNGCLGLSQRQKVDKACALAVRHYAENSGGLRTWGDIDYYLFFYAPNRSVLIRPNGDIDDSVVGLNPPKAELAGFHDGQ